MGLLCHYHILQQGCRDPGRQKFVSWILICLMLICGSSVWNLHYVTVLAPRILRWLLDFLENFYTPNLIHLFLPLYNPDISLLEMKIVIYKRIVFRGNERMLLHIMKLSHKGISRNTLLHAVC